MKKISYIFFFAIVLFLTACTSQSTTVKQEKLPSWNNVPLKTEILNFVESVSKESSADFVAPKDRIAVFDNDGTLWNEKPLYIPVEYEISYIKNLVEERPELKENKLYNGLYEGNLAVMKDYSNFELIHELFAVHAGQSETAYKASVYDFLSNQNHPEHKRPFKEMIYSPMVELVHYLQAHNFKVYIVTGGEISFVRTVSEEIYNIPVENVIGSNVKYKYNAEAKPYLIRTSEISSANDKQVKPANIELHIGKKPIFAAGNSDGDYEMMQYTLSGEGPSMAILVHHDDEEREYKYMHGTEKAIEHADSIGWSVISMKKDWNQIFSVK